jgi:hypothetical protein
MARHGVRVAGILVTICAMSVRAGSDEPMPPSLSVVWVDVAGAAPWAFPLAAREVAALFGRMDVHGVVRRGGVHDAITGSEVVVVLLPRRPANSRLSEGAMGAISTGEESPRSVAVFAAETARTLGLAAASGGWSVTQRRDFGVALGRVVFHELVHTLIPNRPHDRRGIMAASLNRFQLAGSAPPIAPETAEAVRLALGAQPASQPALVADLPWVAEGLLGER